MVDPSGTLPSTVTPAEAGVSGEYAPWLEIPAFAGMTSLGSEIGHD